MIKYEEYLGKIGITKRVFEGLPINTFVKIVGVKEDDEGEETKEYDFVAEILDEENKWFFGHKIDFEKDLFLYGYYKMQKNIDYSNYFYCYIPFNIVEFIDNN